MAIAQWGHTLDQHRTGWRQVGNSSGDTHWINITLSGGRLAWQQLSGDTHWTNITLGVGRLTIAYGDTTLDQHRTGWRQVDNSFWGHILDQHRTGWRQVDNSLMGHNGSGVTIISNILLPMDFSCSLSLFYSIFSPLLLTFFPSSSCSSPSSLSLSFFVFFSPCPLCPHLVTMYASPPIVFGLGSSGKVEPSPPQPEANRRGYVSCSQKICRTSHRH